MSYNEYGMLNANLAERYLADLSKELKKEYGRNKEFELIIVGGAAIMLQYDFRNSTSDIDTVVSMGSSVKGASNRVAEKYGLSDGWLNSDFKKTASYSPYLVKYSTYFKTYNQILTVRIIGGEYLVAMKLVSFRPYKRDRSDIIGVLEEHMKRGEPISYKKVDKAVHELYGSWDKISEEAKKYIQSACEGNALRYEDELRREEKNKELLIDFEKNYEDVLCEENLEEVLRVLRQKQEQ